MIYLCKCFIICKYENINNSYFVIARGDDFIYFIISQKIK